MKSPKKAATRARSHSKAEPKQTAEAGVRKPSSMAPPGGKWTVVQFPEGAPVEMIARMVLEAVLEVKGSRSAGEKWVALLGEFFMGEGRPVLLLSPAVSTELLDSMDEFFEMFGPVTVRKDERSSLAFRGKELVWLQDDVERTYLTPAPKT